MNNDNIHENEMEAQQTHTMPEDEIFAQRKDKLSRLKAEEGYDPFAHDRYDVEHNLKYVKDNYESLTAEQEAGDLIVTAGRALTVRRHGKASFITLQDETDKLQLYFQFNQIGEEKYNFFKKWVDTGDILGVKGHPFRTQRGELSLKVTEFTLLSKALRPLPEKWHGLKDQEVRYRQRYIDLIANPEVKDTFRRRAKIIQTFRRVLESHGTLEVTTPILATLAGGANARPFETFHNALGIPMYLRIATELYLKRLIVGMFGRVYEIGPNFRNEGMDANHNPEFSAMEVYWAYGNMDDMLNLTQEIIVACADEVGGRNITYQGTDICLEPPFRRASMADMVKEFIGIDFYSITDEEARALAVSHGVSDELKPDMTRYHILPMFFEAFVEKNIIDPVFVTGHPTVISPLSKRNKDNPDITDRFELFINGSEFANAFSELNDPIDQRMRFMEQQTQKDDGDEEAHPFDEDFVNALEYAMPPTGGLGIGIDRTVMLLTNSRSIRDVILFPIMKPK